MGIIVNYACVPAAHVEPRQEADYGNATVRAAHMVLADVGQVSAAFHDSMVLVGWWVPELLLPGYEPRRIGSIDMKIARDAEKLNDGRYAESLTLLLATGRYG